MLQACRLSRSFCAVGAGTDLGVGGRRGDGGGLGASRARPRQRGAAASGRGATDRRATAGGDRRGSVAEPAGAGEADRLRRHGDSPRAAGADGLPEPAGRRAAGVVGEHLRHRARGWRCSADRGGLGVAGERPGRPTGPRTSWSASRRGPTQTQRSGQGGRGRRCSSTAAPMAIAGITTPPSTRTRPIRTSMSSSAPRARRGAVAARVVSRRADLRPAARGAGRGGGARGDRADRDDAAVARAA